MIFGDEEEDEATLPGDRPVRKATTAVLETYAEDARHAIAAYERALLDEVEAGRIGRFHYEIGRLYDTVLGDLERAARHLDKALQATPSHLPTVIAARSVRIRAGRFEDAIELFDREIERTDDRDRKAALYFAKARVLQDDLDRAPQAHELYRIAADLADGDPVRLKALEETERGRESWDDLSDVYARLANAVGADPAHRAAVVAQRARLTEVALGQPESATELYELALQIDPDAPGALTALKRLHESRQRWRDLVRVLQREADASEDRRLQAIAWYRIGRIHAERLGSLEEAIASMARAAQAWPEPVVLGALARLHEKSGNARAQVETLTRLAEITADDRERLRLLHQIGELCHHELRDDAAAVDALEAALQIDPTHIPVLRLIAPLYQQQENWDALVRIHEEEAAAITDTRRRATAHARAAAILERTGELERATIHHERALALDPELASSFSALVRLYRRAAQDRKLVELYERALDTVDSDRAIAYLFEIGSLWAGPLEDPEQAEHAYRRVLKLRPRHLGALHALQRVAEDAERWPQLVTALEQELELIEDDRQRVGLLHRAAEVLDERMGRRAHAIERLRRILDIEPHHLPTLAHLGRIYSGERRWKDLVEIYERELEVTPKGPRAVAMLQRVGELYAHELSDRERAAEWFSRALEIDPRFGPAGRDLAEILRARKDYDALVELEERERQALEDGDARAFASIRAAELYEEHLHDVAAAELAYAEALRLRPEDRGTADALARVRTQLERWQDLAEQLEREAGEHEEQESAIAALLRAGEVWSEHVGDVRRSIQCYVNVLERDAAHVGALLALEPLYRRAQAWPQLAALYRRQHDVLADRGAKVAALGERARVMDRHRVGTRDELVEVYDAILSLRGDDFAALAGLERAALRGHDPRILAAVDARLARLAGTQDVAAAHLTRQAESLEVAGNPQAIEVYRRALEQDPESRGALRGLSRMAEVLGDDEALAEAARHEATIARRPARAADAWVRSGRIRRERLGDAMGASDDFARALEAWPDHEEAAECLVSIMREEGRHDMLVERLSRAAAEAKEAARVSAMWVEVARLHARDLDNLGAALSALKRLLGIQPDNAIAMLELAELYIEDRRINEAIDLLERCVAADAPPKIEFRAHLLCAGLREKEGDRDAAFRHYAAALQIAPDDVDTLRRVTTLQLRSGMHSAAVSTAERLLAKVEGEDERITVLVWLAQAQAGSDRVDEAVETLAEAVALEGTAGVAASEMVRVATTREHWERYIEALESFIAAHQPDKRERTALFQEIARTQAERLDSESDAMSTLLRGLRDCDGDPALRFMLAQRLRNSGRHAKAVDHLQTLLMDDVLRVEAWRLLAQTWQELGRERERTLTLSGLAVLGEATRQELSAVTSWRSAFAAVRPGAMPVPLWSDLLVAAEQQAPAAAMLAAICDGLGKLRAPDLTAWGVSSRDRIPPRSDHPVRQFCDHIASIMMVEEYDLYVHRQPQRGVGIENTPKPSLLLPIWIGELPQSQQVYVVARAMADLARGTYPVHLFPPRDLEAIIVAAARSVVMGFGGPIASPELLEDRQRLVMRGLPRRKKRALELAAPIYARTPRIDPATVVQWIHQSSRRIALILCDDLVGTIDVLRRTEELPAARGLQLVRASHVVADLLKVWVSAPAMTLRQQVGLLPGAAAPVPVSRPGP
jgi:tetratricopeptide (TPR) repeat protein